MLKKSIEDDYEQFIELTKSIRNKEARRQYEWRMRILEILYPNELVTREAVTNSILLNEIDKDHKATLNDFIVLYMKYVNKHRKEEGIPYITDKQIENIGQYYKNPEAFKEVKGIEGYESCKAISSYDNLSEEDEYQIYGNHYYLIWKISLEETQAFKKNLIDVKDKECDKCNLPHNHYTIGERIHRVFKSIKEKIL